MDKTRREVYVEGRRDRLFLTWLLASRMNANASVREIAAVELAEQERGERGRVLHFADLLGDAEIQLRMFADADWDRVLAKSVPPRVWLTDTRDIEGYLLRAECLQKVLTLGLGTEAITPAHLLDAVKKHGRQLGTLRLMSEIDSLKLPFQQTNLDRRLVAQGTNIVLNLENFLRALLQNASISLTRFQDVRNRFNEVQAQYAGVPDSEIIHGKDALVIITAALSKFGLDEKETTRLLWTSFEARFVQSGSTLESVMHFLE